MRLRANTHDFSVLCVVRALLVLGRGLLDTLRWAAYRLTILQANVDIRPVKRHARRYHDFI